MSFLTVHRDPKRTNIFSARGNAPFFDAQVDSWVVIDPDLGRDILSSSKLLPSDYIGSYVLLEERLGLDFSTIRHVVGHIPLCNSGELHSRLRRKTGQYLATRRQAIHDMFKNELPELVAGLDRPGRFDLMPDLVRPLVEKFNRAVVGIDLPKTLSIDNVSIIFDRSLGVARRRIIEAELIELQAAIAAQLGLDARHPDVAMRVSLLILGKDALLGSLGESLRFMVQKAGGNRLDEIDLPDMLPATGVGFTERVATAHVEFDGIALQPDERVRVMLQTHEMDGINADANRFFGVGQHACLGRPFSLDLWKSLIALLAKLPRRMELVSHSYRVDNYIFICPESLEVDVT